jgi:hypothetical protein
MKKSVYIVLTRTNTLLSWIIHFIKRDEYTHASISLERDLGTMYSFGRRYTRNPLLGGFKRENVNSGIYEFCKVLPGRVIEVEVSEEQYDQAARLLRHFVRHGGDYHYNYPGLINSLIHREAQYQNRFLCSEFVYHVLKECGIAEFDMPGNLVRPQDFIHCLQGRTLYQGDLKLLVAPAYTRKREKVGTPFWQKVLFR